MLKQKVFKQKENLTCPPQESDHLLQMFPSATFPQPPCSDLVTAHVEKGNYPALLNYF